MKFTELKRHLKSEQLRSCYIITGEDAGVRSFAHRLFTRHITSFPELNITYFEGKVDAVDIVDACYALPFMSDKRLVIVTDFSSDSKKIEEYLANPSSSSILVFESDSIGNNMKKIASLGEIIDCGRQSESFLYDYVAAVAKQNGAKITTNATKLLINYTNRYIFRINGEIAKLASETDLIDEQSIREKVSPDLEVATFALTNVIATKDKEKTLAYLDKMIADGNSAFAITGMLYSQYRKLFYVSINRDSDTLSADLGVSEHSLKFIIPQTKSYTVVQLKKICDIIAFADYGIKSGQIAEKTALYTCVLEILNIK
ncbi:MAG: DNA polymerase III subunit delta [Clostridiales bacterium]|nr:DNA polymerase III subunit delta [Clostridiales bacterium]